jgi:hypothetical protein
LTNPNKCAIIITNFGKSNYKGDKTMAKTVNNIKNALQALGVKGSASIRYINADRVIVNLNGEYFVLWDAEKNTFVD